MALDFQTRDVIHNIVARFVHAFLPDAKKPYNLKAEFQPELDVHGIASKAEVYNIQTDPKVIEEGTNAALELIYYLVADGYRIKTPLFNLRMRLPGEYSGDETHLNEGAYPEARMSSSSSFRQYLRDTVKVSFAGIEEDNGHIGEAVDEATGAIDETATIGSILTIRGHGLKIEADDAHKAMVGLYFVDSSGNRTRVTSIAVNAPKTLKVIVPASLAAGTDYTVQVVTQSSVKNSGARLKQVREITSDFTLTAQ
ncbi:MAG: DUF4469 domain-containing protein [Spirochaetaceae bacterium]|jgi:hypothetical protein|nr:DUF4469 domain-containing protein [Spirochaetaceae bacterium]